MNRADLLSNSNWAQRWRRIANGFKGYLFLPITLSKVLLTLRDIAYSLEMIQDILGQHVGSPNKWLAHESSRFSQNGEDGCITYLLEVISRNQVSIVKHCVEIGVGNGSENNTCNLLFQGWQAYWVDANPDNLQIIDNSFQNFDNLHSYECLVHRSTFDDLRTAMVSDGLDQEPAVFVCDIDSIDLEVLELFLGYIKPLVIIVEIQAAFSDIDFDFSRDADFSRYNYIESDIGYGASLSAYKRLLNGRYTYVYTERSGINSFFVRDDLYSKIKNDIDHPLLRHEVSSRYHLGNFSPKTGHRFSVPKPSQLKDL